MSDKTLHVYRYYKEGRYVAIKTPAGYFLTAYFFYFKYNALIGIALRLKFVDMILKYYFVGVQFVK